MKDELFEILKDSLKGDIDLRLIREASERIAARIKGFAAWKDDPKCPFSTYINGTDKEHEKISYLKDDKNYNLEGVWKFWSEKNNLI